MKGWRNVWDCGERRGDPSDFGLLSSLLRASVMKRGCNEVTKNARTERFGVGLLRASGALSWRLRKAESDSLRSG